MIKFKKNRFLNVTYKLYIIVKVFWFDSLCV